MNCPLCELGELVKRKGRYGEFLGCSRYPNCAYTQQIKGKETKSQKLDKEATAFLKRHGYGKDGL